MLSKIGEKTNPTGKPAATAFKSAQCVGVWGVILRKHISTCTVGIVIITLGKTILTQQPHQTTPP